ncbi:MAG: TonB-dependent receptor plug domain-containing protein [Desulfobacterales bacterium]
MKEIRTKPNKPLALGRKRESFELDAIVVTAGKRKDAVSDIPAHVTVITSEDISAYAGTGITELLAQESGITVRSTFGNDKQAILDLRGMEIRLPAMSSSWWTAWC